MKNTKRIGSINELKVMSELLRFGEVSIPYGNNARYDCILENNAKFLRIQIKTATKIDHNRFSVPFANTKSGKTGHTRKTYTSKDVDYIATYYCGSVYLFATKGHNNMITVSFTYPANGLKQTINLAENYLIDRVLADF